MPKLDREAIEAQLKAAYSAGEGTDLSQAPLDAGTQDEVDQVDAGGASEHHEAGSADETANLDPKASAQDEPDQPQKPGEKSLQERYDILDRNFRAIQKAITPTQQENSRLKKRVSELEARLGEVEGDPEAQRTALKDKLLALKENLPEGAEVIEHTLSRLDRIESQNTSREQETLQVQKDVTMGEIYRQVPDAAAIGNNPEFWSWIDTHAPEAVASMKDILAKPWTYEGGAEEVVSIFNAFKAMKAPKPPAPRKTPTDLATGVRGPKAPDVTTTPGNGRIWSDRQLEEARAAVLRAKGPEARKLRLQLDEQIRLRMGA